MAAPQANRAPGAWFARRRLPPRASNASYACRTGKGGHAALRHARALAQRHTHVLKTDVEHFFESVDQELVLGLVARNIKDRRALDLLAKIVRVPVEGSPPGKGLPIGSLTSQHLANFTLGALDRFAIGVLGCRAYLRYMDDILVFGDDKAALHEVLARLREHARVDLLLTLKERATRIVPTSAGVSFLGFQVFPGTTRLGRVAKARFLRRLRSKRRAVGGRSDRRRWARTRSREPDRPRHAREHASAARVGPRR